MKHLIVAVTVLAASVSAMGQWDSWSRVGSFAEQLKSNSRELSDRTSGEILRGYNKSRNDIQNAFLAQQIDASAGLFLDMTRSRRPVGELKDAAAILTDLSRRAPGFSTQSFAWRRISSLVDDINRELATFTPGGGGGGGGWTPPTDDRPVIGRVLWRGMVDDRVQLVIRRDLAETRTISGTALGSGTYNFGAPLPDRNVNIEIDKKKGRGKIRLIQQPSRLNNYTAIVEVYDEGSGAREYEVDIFWR